MITFANALVLMLGMYTLLGLLFALPFVFRGVHKVDPVAKDGTLGFRLLILPGVIALWPLFVRRLMGGRQAPVETNPHRRAAREKTS